MSCPLIDRCPQHHHIQRNIVFFGETGTGKSSAINLLLGTGACARVSNDSQPCTQTGTHYETTLNGTKCNLWDTRGLGEGRSFFQALFGGGSETELKKFLKERHLNDEIDLLVYCVRGSRATDALVKYYNNFCAITRRLVAPVAIMVTRLEREKDMEDWWSRNSSRFKELEMEFDDHVCITTLPQHPRLAESREKLAALITRHRRWEAKESGSYFGSPVKKPTTSAPPPKGGIWSLFKATDRASVDDESLSRRSSSYPASSAPTTTASYDTADSPADSPAVSTPSSPVVDVQPPTPISVTPSVKVPRINTNLLGAADRPEPVSEESSSMGSTLSSMFYPSLHSSYTSNSEVYLESCTEENEDCVSELPFKHSTATVRRRINYATRSGAFGDIWECDLISGGSPRMVAVKALKTNINTNTNGYEDLRSHEKVTLEFPISWNGDPGPLISFICFRNSAEN
ncbi:hypothetical protein OG21DRAFT_114931 [Imleria badia]|nr:hypothetical protein OG21DRAFT_114931 [Imleria badia]